MDVSSVSDFEEELLLLGVADTEESAGVTTLFLLVLAASSLLLRGRLPPFLGAKKEVIMGKIVYGFVMDNSRP